MPNNPSLNRIVMIKFLHTSSNATYYNPLVESKTRDIPRAGRDGVAHSGTAARGGARWVTDELVRPQNNRPPHPPDDRKNALRHVSGSTNKGNTLFINLSNPKPGAESFLDADWMQTSTPTPLHAWYASAHPCASTNKGIPM